jgi:hypothetical protein
MCLLNVCHCTHVPTRNRRPAGNITLRKILPTSSFGSIFVRIMMSRLLNNH